MYLATGGKKIKDQQLDANEEINIILKSLEEVEEILNQSKIMQSMHALCLFYGFAKLKEVKVVKEKAEEKPVKKTTAKKPADNE